MKRVYLDHNATSPVLPESAEKMRLYLSGSSGNPSSLHLYGRKARDAVIQARRDLARVLGCWPHEVIFTSGGTESNNLALFGSLDRFRELGGQIVTSAIEHSAVLEPIRELGRQGFRTDFLPVDSHGKVQPRALEAVLTEETRLVSIMLANNETGVIQDLRPLVDLAHSRGALFHTDAVQALGKIPVHVETLGVDLLSISGHKFGGPPGTGVLFVREGVKIRPRVFGGGQEGGFRSGTENVPGIVGLADAAERVQAELRTVPPRMKRLRETLRNRIAAEVPNVLINSDCPDCLPHTLSICIPGVRGQDLVPALDAEGVAVSSASACHEGAGKTSHVLRAMGVADEVALGSLRISLGRETTEEDIHFAADRIRDTVKRLRD